MSAWYKDKKLTAHVGIYKNEKDTNKEIAEAGKHGWIPEGADAAEGHINLGRTLTRGVIFGASRSKGKVTIMFKRAPVKAG
jgi:hypothetical protein